VKKLTSYWAGIQPLHGLECSDNIWVFIGLLNSVHTAARFDFPAYFTAARFDFPAYFTAARFDFPAYFTAARFDFPDYFTAARFDSAVQIA
jgi:hypothetical protein